MKNAHIRLLTEKIGRIGNLDICVDKTRRCFYNDIY